MTDVTIVVTREMASELIERLPERMYVSEVRSIGKGVLPEFAIVLRPMLPGRRQTRRR